MKRANPMSEQGHTAELKPCFGDIIENGWASENNPTRVGYFVREGRRTGRLNPGRYFEVTDGKGKFWNLPLDSDHKITVKPCPRRASPPHTGELREAVDYVARYGGMCRDCADNHGVCPTSGLPCDDPQKAIERVLRALIC
jgi:hypothetical protein